MDMPPTHSQERKKEKRKNRKGHGDSKSTVTMLSHAAVTLLVINNQSLRCVCVTGDSKYSLCKSLV